MLPSLVVFTFLIACTAALGFYRSADLYYGVQCTSYDPISRNIYGLTENSVFTINSSGGVVKKYIVGGYSPRTTSCQYYDGNMYTYANDYYAADRILKIDVNTGLRTIAVNLTGGIDSFHIGGQPSSNDPSYPIIYTNDGSLYNVPASAPSERIPTDISGSAIYNGFTFLWNYPDNSIYKANDVTDVMDKISLPHTFFLGIVRDDTGYFLYNSDNSNTGIMIVNLNTMKTTSHVLNIPSIIHSYTVSNDSYVSIDSNNNLYLRSIDYIVKFDLTTFTLIDRMFVPDSYSNVGLCYLDNEERLAFLVSDYLIQYVDLVTCGDNHYYSYNNHTCFACSPGQYSFTFSATTCFICKSGYTPNNAYRNCTICPLGTAQIGDSCVTCPSGSITPQPGATKCLPCLSGYHSKNETTCEICPAGTMSLSGSGWCTQCDIGFYSQFNGSDSCDACPFLYSSAVGSSRCYGCQPGTYGTLSDDGASLCSKCPAGTVNPVAYQPKCDLCPSESFSADDGTKCVPCRKDLWNSSGVCPPVGPILLGVFIPLIVIILVFVVLYFHRETLMAKL